MKKINPIGNNYGNLEVISEHSKTRNGHIRYTCLCKCGKYSNVLLTHLRQGNTISCGCLRPKGKTHKQWTGVGEISGDFWHNHIVRSAKGTKGSRKEVSLTISKEYVWELFLKQNKKCKLTGLELTFPVKHSDKSWTASLDRIDCSKGYDIGNVQWVHKDINMMKRIYSQSYFIQMCHLVSNNNKL